MSRPRALDLFCCGGGVSEGLRRAGFAVVGVDIVDHSRVYSREPDGKLGAGPGSRTHPCPARFVQADALAFLEAVIRGEHGHFDLICASPPCQAHSSLRHLQKGKVYPDLIEPTRELLKRRGGAWCIENVPGAPLGGCNLVMLCGTMFGLQTPDGRAELRRHRLFETSFSIPLRPACQHGHLCAEPVSVTGTGMGVGGKARWQERKVLTVTGHTPVENTGRGVITGNTVRQTFSTDDARHAMGIDWMPMKQLSQAIPPVFAEWIGRQALDFLDYHT